MELGIMMPFYKPSAAWFKPIKNQNPKFLDDIFIMPSMPIHRLLRAWGQLKAAKLSLDTPLTPFTPTYSCNKGCFQIICFLKVFRSKSEIVLSWGQTNQPILTSVINSFSIFIPVNIWRYDVLPKYELRLSFALKAWARCFEVIRQQMLLLGPV